MSKLTKDAKVSKIEDSRLSGYTNRSRSGSEQVFYTGSDARDFDRYRAEGGNKGHGVKMHDKPDTIRLRPPEKHYYAELIDGEWWWLNGCAECNGRPRDSWGSYIECEKHGVCRTCRCTHQELSEPPWGGKDGWQCVPCNNAQKDAIKRERLSAVAAKEYRDFDYWCNESVVCPHCESTHEPETSDGDPDDDAAECDVCGGIYSITANYTTTYTTKVVGERVTA